MVRGAGLPQRKPRSSVRTAVEWSVFATVEACGRHPGGGSLSRRMCESLARLDPTSLEEGGLRRDMSDERQTHKNIATPGGFRQGSHSGEN